MRRTADRDHSSPCVPRACAGSRRGLARSGDQGVALRRGSLGAHGTIFYWRFEDWSFIEALYFSVVTLTTVGYGDLTPTSDGTRIFTIIYIFSGLGVLVALLTAVAQQYVRQRAEGHHARERLGARRHHDRPPAEGESQ
jgi:voltage-gated potassium channel